MTHTTQPSYTGDHWSPLRVLRILFSIFWICLDVIDDAFIFFLITDDAIIKCFLSREIWNIRTNLLATISFVWFDDGRYWWSGSISNNNPMNMVWHNDEGVAINMIIIIIRYLYPCLLCDHSYCIQNHDTINNLSEMMQTIICANRHKISSSRRIIISFFTILFANRQIHTGKTYKLNVGANIIRPLIFIRRFTKRILFTRCSIIEIRASAARRRITV